MTPDVVWISPSQRARTAIILLKGHGIDALPVVYSHDAVVGMIYCSNLIGQDPEASVMDIMEKEYTAGRTSIVPYVNVEPYYDSRYETVNRVRLIGGGTVAWSPRFALETNITYQYDSRSSVTNLYALNIILHLYFETAGAREPK